MGGGRWTPGGDGSTASTTLIDHGFEACANRVA